MISRISSGRLTKLTVGRDEDPLKIVEVLQGRKYFPLLTKCLQLLFMFQFSNEVMVTIVAKWLCHNKYQQMYLLEQAFVSNSLQNDSIVTQTC